MNIGAQALKSLAFLVLHPVCAHYTTHPLYLPQGYPLSEANVTLHDGHGARMLIPEDPAFDVNAIADNFYKVIILKGVAGKSGNGAAAARKFVSNNKVQIQLKVDLDHHKAYEQELEAIESATLESRQSSGGDLIVAPVVAHASKRVHISSLLELSMY